MKHYKKCLCDEWWMFYKFKVRRMKNEKIR